MGHAPVPPPRFLRRSLLDCVAAPISLCSLRLLGGSCTGVLGIGTFLASLLFFVALVTGVVAWIMGMLQAADESAGVGSSWCCRSARLGRSRMG
jgi:hypothetical protein